MNLDGSCQALSKRTNVNQNAGMLGMNAGGVGESDYSSSTIRRRALTPPSRNNSLRDSNRTADRSKKLTQMIESSSDLLKTSEKWKTVVKCLLDFFEYLMPAIQENCAKYATVGCQLRAKNALERLHQPHKTFSVSDQLMLATLVNIFSCDTNFNSRLRKLTKRPTFLFTGKSRRSIRKCSHELLW